jgi:hypothetical protein
MQQTFIAGMLTHLGARDDHPVREELYLRIRLSREGRIGDKFPLVLKVCAMRRRGTTRMITSTLSYCLEKGVS